MRVQSWTFIALWRSVRGVFITLNLELIVDEEAHGFGMPSFVVSIFKIVLTWIVGPVDLVNTQIVKWAKNIKGYFIASNLNIFIYLLKQICLFESHKLPASHHTLMELVICLWLQKTANITVPLTWWPLLARLRNAKLLDYG